MRYGRTVVRVFLRAKNLFDLHHEQAGYWAAVQRCLLLGAEYGVYVQLVIFCDAQEEFVLTAEERASLDERMRKLLARQRRRAYFDEVLRTVDSWGATLDVILWSLSNEPYQNGFSGPLDPELLEYAEDLAHFLSHRDFIIGDARDGDDPDASKETLAESQEIAKRCNIVVLHSSRKGDANPEPGNRLRRWIDHLEGFYDIVLECRKINPRVVGYHEEAMGHASVKEVPLPNGRVYQREYDPQCALAGALTSESAGIAYCYHRIATQDAGTPGLDLIARALATYPVGWHYLNDSWAGSPSHGFTWKAGKVRHYVSPDGTEARTLAYGEVKGDVTWANGFAPEQPPVIDLEHVTVWKVKAA